MPIVHMVEHGSMDWLRLRAGIPTSSRFSEIVTPKTLELSKQRNKYLAWLLAEWILGYPISKSTDDEGNANEFQSQWMTRGLELEDDAVKAYEMLADVETEPVGFITTDDGLIGCSPDRLIGKKKGLELKCPSPQIHTEYMLLAMQGAAGIDDKYKTQLQGQMFVGELESVDICSYHPKLPAVIIPVKRDDDYIKKIEAPIREFAQELLAKRIEIEARYGPFQRPTVEEPDHSADFITDEDAELIIANMRRENAQEDNA